MGTVVLKKGDLEFWVGSDFFDKLIEAIGIAREKDVIVWLEYKQVSMVKMTYYDYETKKWVER